MESKSDVAGHPEKLFVSPLYDRIFQWYVEEADFYWKLRWKYEKEADEKQRKFNFVEDCRHQEFSNEKLRQAADEFFQCGGCSA